MFALAVILLLVLAGISVIVKGEINVSKERVLRKPKSMYVGAGLIVVSLLGWVSGFLTILGLLILVIVAFFMSDKVSSDEPPKM